MATLTDAGVCALLDKPNHAVVTTLEADGSPLSTVVWVDLVEGRLAVNSALGRRWPTNLQRDPRLTVVVYDVDNPQDYVQVQGTATATTEGADAHIDRLAKKYVGADTYPYRQEGEQRVSFLVEPTKVTHRRG